jgi:hypothetical protein
LASGLQALHAAGKIHRDIKPSNVRVTPEGQVKILDFGLAISASAEDADTIEDRLVGTVPYMSPEQASSAPRLGPATDWYAVGVLIYEALTGFTPFEGPPLELLWKKTQLVPPPPRQFVQNVPSDLDALCEGLLERKPEKRTRAAVVLEALQVKTPKRYDQSASGSMGPLSWFTGRDRELEILGSEFERVQHTREARVLVISAASGVGKSTLVAQFIRTLRDGVSDLVVLRGRCYEWETLSYKAMDSVIDELSRHWRRLGESQAQRLLPRDASLLPLLFPVLGRVGAVAGAKKHPPPGDPQVRRFKAIAALRETIGRLSEETSLVLFIDDMQWADDESIVLLEELLRSPNEPSIFLILATQHKGLEDGSRLRDLLARLGDAASIVRLEELSESESARLATALLGTENAEWAQHVTREAAGNPFFLTELAHYIQSPDHRDREAPTVDELMRLRAEELSEAENRLMCTLCVAGEPLSLGVAETAARLNSADLVSAVRSLRQVHLVRSGGKGETIECYHERIRAAVLSSLPEETRRQQHSALANALESSGLAVYERIARHLQAAGENQRAAEFAARAAASAVGTLDFAKAATLYDMALSLGKHSKSEHRRLLIECGDAYANAGQSEAAAAAFAEAADTAQSANEELDLRRRAAEQLCFFGEVDRARSAAGEVARAAGLALPSATTGVLARLLVNEIRLRWGRYRGRQRKLSEETVQAYRTRSDVADSLARGLGGFESLRAFLLMQEASRYALLLDDPDRASRSLSLLVISSAAQGHRKQAETQLEAAERYAERAGHPAATAYLAAARALYAYFLDNDWKRTKGELATALGYWQDAGRGQSWESDYVTMFTVFARLSLGDLRGVDALVSDAVADAVRAGNRFQEVSLRSAFAVRRLAQDKPEVALKEISDGIAYWPPASTSFLTLHHDAIMQAAQAYIYQGNGQDAVEHIEASRREMKRSLLLHIVIIAAEFEHTLARAHLAAAHKAEGKERQKNVARAKRLARSLSKKDLPVAQDLARLILAGVAKLEGDEERATALLREALVSLQASDTLLYANATRRRLGEQLEGEERTKLIAEADLWMARQGVVRPERFCAMLVPGWPEAKSS